MHRKKNCFIQNSEMFISIHDQFNMPDIFLDWRLLVHKTAFYISLLYSGMNNKYNSNESHALKTEI